MPSRSHSVRREHLLAQQQLPSEQLAKYRMEVEVMLEQRAKAVARERTVVRWGWSYVVILSTAFLVISGFKNDSVQGLWFGVMACFWLLLGSTFLMKQLMNQHALETLEALKRFELQLLAQTQRDDERGPE
jgi:hypothetical protein